MRDATKQISKAFVFVSNLPLLFTLLKVGGVGEKNFVSEKLRRSLLQKFITVQMLLDCPPTGGLLGGVGGRTGWGGKELTLESWFANLSLLCLLPFWRHLFNYKVRKMFAYFSADADEAQVMQHPVSLMTAPPAPENVHSVAKCNEVTFFLFVFIYSVQRLG